MSGTGTGTPVTYSPADAGQKGLYVLTEPTVEPVSTAEAKAHMRIEHSADDTYIAALIKAARRWCENFQVRSFISTTWSWSFTQFPCGRPIEVPWSPLQSVTSIKYVDDAGTQQTLATTVYQEYTKRTPGQIDLKYLQEWPSVRGDKDGIEVIYIAGYGNASTDVPEDVTTAIKMLVAELYERREAASEKSIVKIPFGVEALLWPARIWPSPELPE